MPANPNKLSQFWQELKRRKVVRVITVYAAAAFVILEAVDIIFPRMGFPDWTVTFVIFLIVIGFIIAIILSWIYDIHPEGGIVKTEPAHKLKEGDKWDSSNSWKIASYISFVVIVALIILNIIPRSNRKEILEKSIAVLPFRNDSPDEEKMYFINGTMEAILDNLCKIEDLRVPGRTSVEQYRDNPKPIPTVAEEMDVSYILEGSGHRDGNNVRIVVQLLDGRKDQHLWSKTYDADIEEIFSMQSEIAQLVATEIEAMITPEEKQLIEKIPTANLTAYDFYQRGKEEYWKYWLDNKNRRVLENAEGLYYKALEYDSTFAQAYAGLARVYWDKHYWETYFSEIFLDSVPIFIDIALSYDNQLADAYTIRGKYYSENDLTDRAINEFDKAIEFNPNNWVAYYEKGRLYSGLDYIKSIENYHKAVSLNRGPELPELLRFLGRQYLYAGFQEKDKLFIQEAFNLDNDSLKNYWFLARIEMFNNHAKAVELFQKSAGIDSNNYVTIRGLASGYMYLGEFERSLGYFKKAIEIQSESTWSIMSSHRLGYVYWQTGFKKEAEYYFDEQEDICNRVIELGRSYAQNQLSYYDLAGVHAFRGDKEKAYENLMIFKQRPQIPLWLCQMIKTDPLFNSIRDDPEFQQIIRDVEAKYHADHERVRQWLEENDML